MSNVAKLKKRALEYEQKKQFDKALDTYVLVLAELDDHIDEADVALYNRVGDLLLRKGDVSEAVDHYERAVDLYTDGGFFNNAIALCNKILRNAPGRNSIYYKLGKISAQKGFINDAKQNFLEYADRMQRGGQLEEAFRSLKEFADLCPDQDDIRLMLADQLVKRDRKEEAIEQLQALYDKFTLEGRGKEARATVDRMKAIDETLEPTAASAARPETRANDLVFLDVDYDTSVPPKGAPARATKSPTPPPPPREKTPAPAAAAPVAEAPAAKKKDAPPPPAAEIDLPLLEIPSGDTPAEHPAFPDLTVGSSITVDGPDSADEIRARGDQGRLEGFEGTSLLHRSDEDKPLIEREASVEEMLGVREDEDAEQARARASAISDLPMLDVDEPPSLEKPPAKPSEKEKGKDKAAAKDADLDELPDIEPPSAERATKGLTLILPDEIPAHRKTPGKREKWKSKEFPAIPDTPRGRPTPVDATPAAKAPERGGAAASGETKKPRLTKRQTPARIPELQGLEEEGESIIDAAFAGSIASAVDDLRARLQKEPTNWTLRRELGEALLENGERAAGLKALEEAMTGLEKSGELGAASSITEELLRVEPNSVRYHQKRVEYAVRSSDRPRLVDAYLALAECLFRSGQLDKSRAVYGRVVELAPEDARARTAMQDAFGTREIPVATLKAVKAEAEQAAIEVDEAPAEPVRPKAPTKPPVKAPDRRRATTTGEGERLSAAGERRRGEPKREEKSAPPPPAEPPKRVAAAAAAAKRDSFVNLSDWLRDDEAEVAAKAAQDIGTQDEGGFAQMLSKFKQGVAASVEETDHESHYDLGVAYKEMGLLDEAISQFQKALRGTEQRVRTYEALGQCFVEKRQYQIALTILSRAMADKSMGDDTLIGVLYLLGYASESLGQMSDALAYYERVFAVDIQFRDIADRLAAAEKKSK